MSGASSSHSSFIDTAPEDDLLVFVVIPAFNEEDHIEAVVKATLRHSPHVLVVDDGSTDSTSDRARLAGACVLRLDQNQGKGASLEKGFEEARKQGADVVVTLDADGQHDPDEIPRFIDAYRRTNIPVLVGNRLWSAESLPLVRRATNRFMSCFLNRLMQQYIPDTQCGFRLYRAELPEFVPSGSKRFAMESEILLNLSLRGFRMDSVRITPIYRGEKSKIKPVGDALRFLRMVIRFTRYQRRRYHAGRVQQPG